MEHCIKYIAVARIHDNTLIATYPQDPPIKLQSAAELKKILADLAFTDWRQKFASSFGCWFMITDGYRVGYLVLTKADYPERHAWNLLEDLKNLMYQQGADTMQTCPADTYTRILSSELKALAGKYDDLSNIDKVYKVNQRVLEVQDLAQQNIHQVMRNIDNAETINTKAEEMEHTAGWFNKQARTLKRTMCLRNFRITIILILVILVIIAIIVAVIASSAN